MATETVPHDKVMSSIEMFGKHVIPELKKKGRRAPAARQAARVTGGSWTRAIRECRLR